jgi:hypothetical protein
MHAWTHGDENKNGHTSLSYSWKLPVPDELELNAAEIELARPWNYHSLSLAEQMESMTVDQKQQIWYAEAI